MLSFHHFKFGLHGFASRVQVAMVAMADHRTSTAHTIRAKSKSWLPLEFVFMAAGHEFAGPEKYCAV
jgi:hypothetical protein